jgi:hypothetical protein
MGLPFNRILLRSSSGNSVVLTVHQFNGMPLTERVRAVMEKRVQFFADDTPVAQDVALRALREGG